MHLYEISNQISYYMYNKCITSCFDNVVRCVLCARALGPDTVYLLVTPKSCLLRAVSGSRSGSGCKARLHGYSSDMCVISSCCETPYCGRWCYRLPSPLDAQVHIVRTFTNHPQFNHANALPSPPNSPFMSLFLPKSFRIAF